VHCIIIGLKWLCCASISSAASKQPMNTCIQPSNNESMPETIIHHLIICLQPSCMPLLLCSHSHTLTLTHTSRLSRQPNRYREQAEKTAAGFVERLQEMAMAMPQMCCALYLQALSHPRQVGCQVVLSDLKKCPDVAQNICAHHCSVVCVQLCISFRFGCV